MSAVGATVAGIAGHSIASENAISTVPVVLNESLPLADIQINTRVSAIGNDLEILITNVGERSTTITQLTPSVTMTQGGQFDFGQLMKKGDIAVSPGQSISVPIQPHALQVSAMDAASQQAHSLTEALRRTFSVITENDAFAKVTIVEGVQFV